MGYLPYTAAATRLTSSGLVSDTGVSIIICGYATEGGAGGLGTPYFLSGTATTAASSTGVVQFRGDNSQGSAGTNRTTVMPTFGITMVGGCYVSFDASTAAVTVFYSLNG